MLGNNGNIGKVSGAAKPLVDDTALLEQQNDFVNIDNTKKFEELAKELNMSPKELRSSIDKGNIDPKKLIEALNKVSKVPGVSVDKVAAQKAVDKAQLGKILDTAAKQLDYSNFNELIKALPENKSAAKSTEAITEAVVSSGTTATEAYLQLKPPSFENALKRRLDKTGAAFNTAA